MAEGDVEVGSCRFAEIVILGIFGNTDDAEPDAPSMHFVADLSNWDNSLNNITLGESSNIFSGHYSDQWDTYYYGHSLPMQFTHVEAKEVLRVRPEK